MTSMNRRCFTTGCVAGIGSLALQGSVSARSDPSADHPIAVFAKPMQNVAHDELGRRLKSMGVDGIEATLRKHGQIEPENVGKELEGLCDALAKHDQRVIIAASDVNEVNTASEQYLQQLEKHGVLYFRMGYYRYDLSKPVLPQLDTFTGQATELAELCKSLGITALYQNHAGKRYVGAALWDLQRVLAEISPKHIAVALDVRHGSLELAQSYEAGYSAIRSHIGATYVKDFDWINGKPDNVPLGAGRSKPLFDLLLKNGLVGPISLHMEYIDHRGDELLEQRWVAVENDVRVLNEWLNP